MLRIVMGGTKTDHKNGYTSATAYCPHYLLLCFHTPFFCVLNGKRVEGAPGDCLLHRPGSPAIHGPLSEDTSFINDWCYFTADETEIDDLELPFDTPVPMGRADIFSSPLGDILKEKAGHDLYSERLIADTLYRMLVTIKRATKEKNREDPSLYLQFSRARTRFLYRCGEKWTLERMAEPLGYSVSRFCALYTEFFGKSPMSDLLEMRLEMAKQLLELGVHKIEDVAQMCGFSSIHYFSNFFKKHTGRAPSAY